MPRIDFRTFFTVPTARDRLRQFGLLLGGIVLALGIYSWWRSGSLAWPWPAVAALLILTAELGPALLRPLYQPWMILAKTLGLIVTYLLLTVLFVVAFIPGGVLLRLRGRDPLHRHWRTDSYWIARDRSVPSDMERMF